MNNFKFLRTYIIREEYGETEEFEFHSVGPLIYNPYDFSTQKRVYYKHRETGEVISGQVVREGDFLYHLPPISEVPI
jgi:hypothetical protein